MILVNNRYNDDTVTRTIDTVMGFNLNGNNLVFVILYQDYDFGQKSRNMNEFSTLTLIIRGNKNVGGQMETSLGPSVDPTRLLKQTL